MDKRSLFLAILALMYPSLIRPAIQKAIDDPEADWDDEALKVLDHLFDYIKKM